MSNTVSYKEIREMMEKGKRFILLDVRERHEMQYGMIPGAVNLPMSELEPALMLTAESFRNKYGFDFPRDVRVIAYCRTGRRSGRVAEFLRSRGFDAASFDGSVQEWSLHDDTVRMY